MGWNGCLRSAAIDAVDDEGEGLPGCSKIRELEDESDERGKREVRDEDEEREED